MLQSQQFPRVELEIPDISRVVETEELPIFFEPWKNHSKNHLSPFGHRKGCKKNRIRHLENGSYAPYQGILQISI